jgi:hypothetical protein
MSFDIESSKILAFYSINSNDLFVDILEFIIFSISFNENLESFKANILFTITNCLDHNTCNHYQNLYNLGLRVKKIPSLCAVNGFFI